MDGERGDVSQWVQSVRCLEGKGSGVPLNTIMTTVNNKESYISK